jgi:riboflavin synthase
MFTGLVKAVGNVEAIERTDAGVRVRISAPFTSELSGGDSVAVAGVCLTVTELDGDAFAADVMNQTLGLTTLGGLEPGDRVNLEPALRAGEPLGGHIVQGHVDCTGDVTATREDGTATRLDVALPAEHRHLVVLHGSVTLDGVSLTVAGLTEDGFEVSLIPETLARTTLSELAKGDRANVELDVIARYVERLLEFERSTDD